MRNSGGLSNVLNTGGFKPSKLKPLLKMAVSRFQILSNKKTALMTQQKREIAKLLAEVPVKEEKARIRAEALIREHNTIEAYEILQLTCEILCERIKLIASQRTCPSDLRSSISTLIWAANQVEVPELVTIKKQFRAKYGQEFEDYAMAHTGLINERVVSRLSVQPPTAYLIEKCLEEIADEFEINWKPTQCTGISVPAVYSGPHSFGPIMPPVIITGGTVAGDDVRQTPNYVFPNVASGRPGGGFDNNNNDDGAGCYSTVGSGSIGKNSGSHGGGAGQSSRADVPDKDIFSSYPTPIVQVMPLPGATPVMAYAQRESDIEEPDIFIPKTFGQTGGVVLTQGRDDVSGISGSNASESSSFADLKARFNKLKR